MTLERIIAILLTVILAGCQFTMPTQHALKKGAQEPDMELFIAGIDQFDPGHRSESFLKLGQDHPNSPWNQRAKVLAGLAGTIRILEKQIKRQKALLAEQQEDHQTLISLRQENALLHEQVKALKSLIVDLELRQP